jgi:GT2 family glycosyltransferase
MAEGAGIMRETGAVVVAHARLDAAARCVASIRRFLPPASIVLVVNAPDQVDQDALAALRADAAVVSPAVQQGYGANLNLGVRALPEGLRFAVLANDDVELVDDALPRLVRELDSTDRLGCVGPGFVGPSGEALESVGRFPTAFDAIVRSGVPSRPQSLVERLGAARQRDVAGRECGSGYEPVDWVVGAAIVVRLDTFSDVAGFDERFFLYYEETDFCFRLWRAGWKVGTVPEAVVVHAQGSSTSDERYRRMVFAARRRYLIRRLGRLRWALLEPVLALTFVSTAGWSLAATVVRPSTLPTQLAAIRARWRSRLFLS